ncbi:hypothetical protein ABZY44_36410 [Streptomyces sp. NPDC006544]|uniref:hypothetical protein n=1 Tax=Streptomyces sp. NPDC006544 TaxID=3154583 RepID=UPI0033B6E68A
MMSCSTMGGRARRGTARAVASVAALAALATGCREDAAPAWEYPELRATLTSLSRALDEGCGGESCADELDRLDALAERAFAEALDRRLLDDAYVGARNRVDRARHLRLAAAAQARSLRDPHYPPLERAQEAERLAYRQLLAALEKVRSAPPPGDGGETA